jgi:tRNA 2-thiocytidine biosynthesis protein TtcA
LCGSQENLQRKQIKQMLAEWELQYPGRMTSIFNALSNVVPSHLADLKLFDFQTLGTSATEEDTVFDPPEIATPSLGIYKIG